MLLHKDFNDTGILSTTFIDKKTSIQTRRCKLTSITLIDRFSLFTKDQQNQILQTASRVRVTIEGDGKTFVINYPSSNSSILETWISFFQELKSTAPSVQVTTSSFTDSITLIQLKESVFTILFTETNTTYSYTVPGGQYVTIQPTFSFYEFVAWLQNNTTLQPFLGDSSLRNGLIQLSFPQQNNAGNYVTSNLTPGAVFRSSRSNHFSINLETYKVENVNGGGVCAYLEALEDDEILIEIHNSSIIQRLEVITSDPYGLPSLLFYDYSMLLQFEEVPLEISMQRSTLQYSTILNSGNSNDFTGYGLQSSFAFPIPDGATKAKLSSVIAIRKSLQEQTVMFKIQLSELNTFGGSPQSTTSLNFPSQSPSAAIHDSVVFWSTHLNLTDSITTTASNFKGSTTFYKLMHPIRISLVSVPDNIIVNAWTIDKDKYIPFFLASTVAEYIGFAQAFLLLETVLQYNPLPVSVYGSTPNSFIRFTCNRQSDDLQIINTDSSTADITNTQTAFGTWNLTFDQPFSNSIPAKQISVEENEQTIIPVGNTIIVNPYVAGRNSSLVPLILIDYILQLKFELSFT